MLYCFFKNTFFFLGANCFGKCLRFWTKNCKKINFDTDLEKLQKFGGGAYSFPYDLSLGYMTVQFS